MLLLTSTKFGQLIFRKVAEIKLLPPDQPSDFNAKMH